MSDSAKKFWTSVFVLTARSLTSLIFHSVVSWVRVTHRLLLLHLLFQIKRKKQPPMNPNTNSTMNGTTTHLLTLSSPSLLSSQLPPLPLLLSSPPTVPTTSLLPPLPLLLSSFLLLLLILVLPLVKCRSSVRTTRGSWRGKGRGSWRVSSRGS